jgi:hypothetical protein
VLYLQTPDGCHRRLLQPVTLPLNTAVLQMTLKGPVKRVLPVLPVIEEPTLTVVPPFRTGEAEAAGAPKGLFLQMWRFTHQGMPNFQDCRSMAIRADVKENIAVSLFSNPPLATPRLMFFLQMALFVAP